MNRSITPSIDNMIMDINESNPTTGDQLAEIISRHAPRKEEMMHFADFDHPNYESYGRTLLYHKNNFCIYLMSWKPGDFTAIHDHGTTEWGCVYAFDDFTHRLYSLHANTLILKSKNKFLRGRVARIRSGTIHMMGNLHNHQNNLSLHIYGTNTPEKGLAKQSKVYYPEVEKASISNGPAFLYTSRQTEQHHKTPFQTENETLKDYLELRINQANLSKNTYPEISAYQSSQNMLLK